MSVVTQNTSIRERLKAVREEKKELTAKRAELRKERDAAKAAFSTASHDGKVTEWPEFEAAEQAVASLGECEDSLADAKLAEDTILKLLGERGSSSDPRQPGANGLPAAAQGWYGERLVEEDSMYRTSRDAGIFSSSAKFGTIMLGQIASREDAVRFLSELPNADPGIVSTQTAGGIIRPDYRGIIAPMIRPLRFLDLIPTGTTDSNSIEYVQIVKIPGNAAPTAEGTAKPQQGIETKDETAPVRTIAGWIKMNRQAMDDAAALVTIINTLLPYDVRRKIEGQILAGDGTGQNLTGILEMDGLGEPAWVEGDNIADAILRAMTVVILAGFEPNFTALYPTDWQDLLLMREVGGSSASDRSGQYLYGGPGTMAAAQVWGLTITPSIVIPVNEPLVGDSNGCTLLVREGVNVKTSDSDQDDFIKNRVTTLAEARVAFPVWYPSAFASAAKDDTP